MHGVRTVNLCCLPDSDAVVKTGWTETAGGCVDGVALDGGMVVSAVVPGVLRDPRRPFIHATCSGVNGGASLFVPLLFGPAGCTFSGASLLDPEAIAHVGLQKNTTTLSLVLHRHNRSMLHEDAPLLRMRGL